MEDMCGYLLEFLTVMVLACALAKLFF